MKKFTLKLLHFLNIYLTYAKRFILVPVTFFMYNECKKSMFETSNTEPLFSVLGKSLIAAH